MPLSSFLVTGKSRRDRSDYNRSRARITCLRKYGLTVADYERMLQEQGGGCAICGKVYLDKPLCVDHNHTTNQVRKLLCHRCNNLVGMFESSADLQLKVLGYLAAYKVGD